jgi:hypothetical protein
LKYTRTVDVIRSVIERIISTYEHAIDSLLKCYKEEGIIEEIPKNPIGKAALIKEHCDEDKLCNYIENYLTLRKIMREEYTKREEFRRHVTMVLEYEGQTLNVDIDLLKEYYDETGEFLKYVRQKIEPYKNDEDN